MSSDPQSSNEETQRTRRRGPSSGVGSWFWFLLVGAILFLVFFGNNLHGRSTLAYSQFLEVLSRPDEVAKIEKVIYRDESRLDVTLRKDQLLDLGKDAAKLNNTRFEVRLPLQKDEKLLARLQELSAGGKMTISQEEDPLAGIGTLILFFLPALIILGIFFLVLPRMRDPLGGGFLNNYIRSPARKYEKGKTRITFEDVAGMENAKSELREIVEFLKNPEKFARLGATVPKGVLLFGSPGTGKTLLAKAVAGEAGVPFYSINGSEFIQMFVGVGASRVRDMFKTAKENAPCILFIDEIDAVGRMRGAGVGGGSDEREQTLNQILSEMDGFAPSETVIVMAATNRPDVLDSALLRPGRFDRHITVEKPTWQGRMAILKVHTRNKPLADDVNMELLARKLVGMTGADLRNLANEAALLATREGKDRLFMADFERAADRVLIGPKREEVLTGDDKRRTANHEAGHALVTWLMPGADRPQKVSIIPRGQSLGVTLTVPDEDRFHYGKDQFERQLVMTLGGRAADILVYNQPYAGAESDHRLA
jgi:cell division protease FtsH